MPKVYVSPQGVVTVIGKSRAAFNAEMGGNQLAAWCRESVRSALSEVSPHWEIKGARARGLAAYTDSLGKKWYNCTS